MENVLRSTKNDLLKYRQKNMSMVFQKFSLFPHKTVIENISYGLMIQKFSKNIILEKSMSWLKKLVLMVMKIIIQNNYLAACNNE